LKKKAPVSAVAQMEEQFKEKEKRPSDSKNLMIEEKNPAPFGIAWDGSGPGPAYPSP
jgi:hypothetical protein